MYGAAFHRPARSYPDALPQSEITLALPPSLSARRGGSGSIVPLLIPLIGTLGSLSFYLFGPYKNPVVLIAVGFTMLASVGGGIFMAVGMRRGSRREARTTREKYLRYLDQHTRRLEDIARRQQAVYARLNPDLDWLADFVARREYVWERRASDPDYLETRVGVGVVPLCCPLRLETSVDPFAEHDPELLAKARATITRFEHLDDGPAVVGLRDIGAIAVSGNRADGRALVRAMLCHIAAFHAPDDVRIMAYTSPEAVGEWSWLKWLPHTRRLRLMKLEKDETAEPLCLLADSVEDFRRLLSTQIVPEVERRRKLNEDTTQRTKYTAKPHFILIVDGIAPGSALARIPALDELFHDAHQLGVTLICLVEDRASEPSVLNARIEISDAGWLSFEQTAQGGRRLQGVRPDAAPVEQCERVARSLAPLILSDLSAQSDLSQDVRLLELLKIPSADDVNTRELWRPRDRPHLLRVPIGMCADGTPLVLDVKEASEGGMGPHGLIIGATGSGKSELLRTIVTSLALTHDPETVSFVLADFKGGASFADLAGLPHTAGMITNLQSDLTLVDRMRAALFGEQERRQRMLRDAGNLDNIQQYHAKRALMPAIEPMPHLLIIVDEFAELLTSRPDFLDLFVAIGRVGRSLGMHLLLATQRLSEGRIQGLEGHLRYRICLRTFSASESSAVIGTQDAFYLPSFPGIGYFKVDTTIYKQFKTALVSNPYVAGSGPSDTALVLREFTPTGKLALLTQPGSSSGPAAPAGDALRTDMDVVIAHLVEQRRMYGGQTVHQVWLPPLGSDVTLADLFAALQQPALTGEDWPDAPPFGPLRIPIGLLDRPLEQTQEALLLDFSGAGGHLAIAGAPQSGKSTLLQNILGSFIATHQPRDAQFYCVDLGGGLLRALESAPHVGAVCGKSERDKVRRLVQQVRAIIEERDYLFRERHIDGMSTFRQRRQGGELADVPFGDVFLVIDDLAQFYLEFDQLELDLVEIVMGGLTYGVHLIAATNRWVDVKPKLRDNIGARLELRLNDPVESEVGKAAALGIQGSTPGRGLVKSGLQFQAALPVVAPQSEETDQSVQQVVEEMACRARLAWHGAVAPPIRLLPAMVLPDQLTPQQGAEPAGVPIGLEEFQLDPIYIDVLSAGPHFLIFGDAECGKTTLLRHWMREVERRATAEQVRFAVIDYRRNLLECLDSPHLVSYAGTPNMLKECVDRLKGELDARTLLSATPTIEELRNPRTWSGPHYVLFVDDYDAILTPSGNPLSPLVELIGQARDVGFHVVLARRVAGTGRTAFEPVFQRLKETGSPGLIMNGDPQEGPLLGTQKAAALPPGRGYLVRRNQRTLLVQTVYVEPRSP
jgi:DNA segregation ATPase FtsK/SpoIIIE, S-DNA-T family